MEAMIGGAFLSASVEKLVGIISSGEFIDYFRRAKLDGVLIYKVKTTLLRIQSELRKGGDKQFTDDLVKEWRNTLQDVVYEAEDLFDEINTEALRCNVEADQVLKKCFSYFKKFNKEINAKLLRLYEKLDYLKIPNPVLQGDSSFVRNVTPTSPVLGDQSAIYGRDDEKITLIERLLSDDGCDSENKIGVISIVGMGGLGKTTLARLLYNDHHVKERFEVRGWAHVSKDLDVFAVTKTLLESVTPKTDTTNKLNNPHVQLQQTLRNKKFLLVLDDIWYGNYVGLNSLIDVFNVGRIGSKIIITTRDEKIVLPRLKSLCVHPLEPLGSDASWTLLARHAFVETNSQEHPNLIEIGEGIAKKCGGLPLALITLGAILRTKVSHDHWSEVLKNGIGVWDCKKLRSLPESIKTLTSLQYMNIRELPNLQSFSIDDLPITLRELSIGEVGGIWWNTTWEHLTCLSKLYIDGDDIVKGLMERQVPLLPTNLVTLHISNLKDVECLDGKWIQHLTSLHSLDIFMAPKLKSLPESGELPSSLKELHINDCPLLEEDLRRKKGKEWSKISHIPKIYVNHQIIQ